MSTSKHHSPPLPELWPIIRRYPWRLTVPAFLVAALVLLASFFLPRKYKAEAIFERRMDMVLTEMTSRGTPTTFEDPRASLQDELAGAAAIDTLLREFYGNPEHPVRKSVNLDLIDREALRWELRYKVVVNADVSTMTLDRIRVTFVSEYPELARAVVNGLIENYIQRARQRIESRLRQSSEFFQAEVERCRRRIEELENKKLAFEIKNAAYLSEGIMFGPTGPVLMDPQSQLLTLQQQYEEAGLKLEALRKTYAETPAFIPSTVVSRNPERVTLENRLRELNAQLQTCIGQLNMTDRHPDVIALRQQIEALRQQIEALPEEVVTQKQSTANPKKAELEVMIAATEAQYQSLGRQIEALKARLWGADEQDPAKLFPIRSEHLRLQRELAEAQRQLTFWEDNLRRVQMAMTAESGNRGVQYAFLKPCGPLSRPISPSLAQVLMVAIAMALVAGLSSAYLAYRGDETFGDPERLARRAELPLFGSVSEILSSAQRRRRWIRRRLIYPLASLAMVGVLAILTGLLYLDLQRPSAFQRLKNDPWNTLRSAPGILLSRLNQNPGR